MTETIEQLANYIVEEIEKEDFIHAMKHYGGFKMKTTAKKIIKWCDNI